MVCAFGHSSESGPVVSGQ